MDDTIWFCFLGTCCFFFPGTCATPDGFSDAFACLAFVCGFCALFGPVVGVHSDSEWHITSQELVLLMQQMPL